jgi:DNA-binding NarL/FixJ family response regulator
VAVMEDRARVVGRERELAEIDAALRDVGRGERRVLALLGEAGIGKTALLDALRESATGAGLQVLEGRAGEHERDVPFGAVTDALDPAAEAVSARRLETLGADRVAELAAVLPAVARHASSSAPPAGGAAERFRFHRALASLLDLLARERPLVLVLDDVHWADGATLEWILHLLRRPPQAAHLLAVAMRPVEAAPRLLDALRSARGASMLELGPLGEEAALRCLNAIPDPGLRRRMADEAGGNPLFLHELARVADLRGPLPPTIVAAVGLEAGALGGDARLLLDGAAVIGDPFEPGLAAAAAGLERGQALAALDALVAADLVRPDGGRRFRFRHPLVRRAVYDVAPAGWRLAAHERAAAALAAQGASATAQAYHVEQCAQPGDEAAITVLTDAGHAAAETAPATAARWYGAALELVPAGDVGRRIGLLAPMAIAQGAAGRLHDCHASLTEVLRLLPDEPADALRATLVAGVATVEQMLGRNAEAIARLRSALEALGPDGNESIRAQLEVDLAATAAWMQDAPLAREHASRAEALAVDGQPAILAQAHAIGAIAALWLGRGEDAEDGRHAANEGLRTMPDDVLSARPVAVYYVAFADLFCERFESARQWAERGLRLARQSGQGRLVAPLAALHAMTVNNLGDVSACLAAADVAQETSRLQNLDFMLYMALYAAVTAQLERDDHAAALALHDEGLALAPRLEDSLGTRSGLVNFALVHRHADPERFVREVLAAGGQELEGIDRSWGSYVVKAVALALIELGRLDEAAVWGDRLEQRVGGLPLPVGAERLQIVRAAVDLARDDAPAAAERALAAAATLSTLDAGLDRRFALDVAGRAQLAAGDREGATRTLLTLVAEAGRSGAVRPRDAAARELRRLGVRVEARAAEAGADLEALSPREREIAALVAEGMSNKAIAARIYLSEKTVERHLSNSYAKLGVRGRAELAALVGRAA